MLATQKVLRIGRFSFAALILVVSMMAILAGILNVVQFHYPYFHQDEWVSLSFYYQNGFWKSVLCRHNGHPVIIPNLVYRLLYLLDGTASIRSLATSLTSALGFLLIANLAFRDLIDRAIDSKVFVCSVYALFVSIGLWFIMPLNCIGGWPFMITLLIWA